MKRNQYLYFVLPVLLAVTTMCSVTAQKTDVTGKWNMIVETDQGAGNPVFVLKQENDTVLSGSYQGMFGEAPVQGTLDGDKISLGFSVSGYYIAYTGTVEGNTMKGNISFGGMGEGSFTGNKQVAEKKE